MQPKPRADTSKLLFPSVRFCITCRCPVLRLRRNAWEPVSRSCRIIARSCRTALWRWIRSAYRRYAWERKVQNITVRNTSNGAVAPTARLQELNAELAYKVARLIGTAERLPTAIPRLTLARRTACTAACPVTYEPSVVVLPQGRKQVQVGSDLLTYDSSRYLLTSVDLPTVT